MLLLQISIENRIIIGIAAMVILFASFMIAFVISQRKKMQYQSHIQAMLEQKQQMLSEQNILLEKKVAERTIEINRQKEALQVSINDLKLAQQQLVQSEKMASLGEMSAGIAHEIQNPLNFINNFSDVSIELFDEWKAEMAKGYTAELSQLAKDIQENLAKINMHGKRADGIIKSMLEHTRTGSGKKVLTSLNELVAESLKLSQHGQKAKNKAANTKVIFEAEADLQPMQLIPQDISRVIINLCNNAFYAVWKKQQQSANNYQPTVSVRTKINQQWVMIEISDNGTGIPSSALSKIFQPFFTTKPSGEGTGLGLSLSYDIITKAYNGNIQVDSTEGQGTVFTITLPIA